MNMRLMQTLIRISAIRGKSEALGLSLFALCREAGVGYSKVWRWLNGRTRQPGLRDYDEVCTKLEAALAARLDRAIAAPLSTPRHEAA